MKRQTPWDSRRGQPGAEQAIDSLLDPSPQSGEQIQSVADQYIDDSPYQARRAFDQADVEDLAQAMREAGFQGVLIARPHHDTQKRLAGRYELAYGHRRRAAWRLIAAERSEACVLPILVRQLSDAQMLTIGAQENLQRQDLDALEEAQIVAWHERVFYDKNQAEIGAMLGKTSDWVSIRSRVHHLPDPLKQRLLQRPRAISQFLELVTLYEQATEEAVALADRIVRERLTLDAVRQETRGYRRPEQAQIQTNQRVLMQPNSSPRLTQPSISHIVPSFGSETSLSQHPFAPSPVTTQLQVPQASLGPKALDEVVEAQPTAEQQKLLHALVTVLTDARSRVAKLNNQHIRESIQQPLEQAILACKAALAAKEDL